LGGRKGTQPVKKLNGGCWHGYLSGEGTDLHMAQLMPLPLTVSCFSKIQIGFTFLVPAQLGIVEKEKTYVCVFLLNPAEIWFLLVIYKQNISLKISNNKENSNNTWGD